MTRPSVIEAWRQARAQGIGVEAAERLRRGEPVEIDWFPPVRWADGPQEVKGHRYGFRLHRGPEGWIVEGTDGRGPWEQCEGPIMDSGRAPWLARPKEIGGAP